MYKLKPFIWSSHTIISNLLNRENIHTILDVGCGGGFLGSILNKSKKIYGVDKEDLVLLNYVVYWKEDLETTNFSFLKENKFHAIVLADVLEHLENPQCVVTRLKEYLDKDGFFIFSFPNMDFFIVRILSFFGIRPKMKRGLYDKTHKYDFNMYSVEQFIKELKLEVMDLIPTPVPLPLFSHIFNQGEALFFVYQAINYFSKKFPKLFAYQIIYKTKITQP